MAIIRYDFDRLDAAAALTFQKNILTQLPEQDEDVVLDITAVKFMDSSGLGAIVSLMQIIPEKKHLLLYGVGDSVKTLLRKTHLDNILPLYEGHDSPIN